MLSWLVLRRSGLNDAQTALIVTQVGSNTEFSGDGGRFWGPRSVINLWSHPVIDSVRGDERDVSDSRIP